MTLIEALFGFLSLGSSLGRIGIGTQGEAPPVITFYLLQEDAVSLIVLEDGTGFLALE